MAEITIDERTMKRVSDKTGLYSSLRKIQETTKETRFILELRAQLLKTIEVAFREYAKQHKGCTTKIENEAWKRFERKLKKYL